MTVTREQYQIILELSKKKKLDITGCCVMMEQIVSCKLCPICTDNCEDKKSCGSYEPLEEITKAQVWIKKHPPLVDVMMKGLHI